MGPSITINLPEPAYEDCERRLREAGLKPYTSTRVTTEWLNPDRPPEVKVEGCIAVGRERFDFAWRLGKPSLLEVRYLDHPEASQLALFDAIEAVFPFPKPPPSPPQRQRKTPADYAWHLGCALFLLVLLAVASFAVYGFAVFSQRH